MELLKLNELTKKKLEETYIVVYCKCQAKKLKKIENKKFIKSGK